MIGSAPIGTPSIGAIPDAYTPATLFGSLLSGGLSFTGSCATRIMRYVLGVAAQFTLTASAGIPYITTGYLAVVPDPAVPGSQRQSFDS